MIQVVLLLGAVKFLFMYFGNIISSLCSAFTSLFYNMFKIHWLQGILLCNILF